MENKDCLDNLDTTESVLEEEVTEKSTKPKKKIIIIVSIIAAIIAVIIGLTLQSSGLQVLESSITLEYGDELSDKIEDYLDLSTYSSEEIATMQEDAAINLPDIIDVGEYIITINYESKTYEITVVVQDTTAPTFEVEEDLLAIEVLQDGSLNDDFLDTYVASDLAEVEVTYDDSEVDYSTTGEYIIYITAKDSSDNEYVLEVTVTIVSGEIELEETKITLTEGDTYTLEPSFTGVLSDDDTYTYTSNDKDIATVNTSGKVTAVEEGKTTITISIKDATYEVTVTVEEKTSSSSSSSSSSSGSSSSSSSSSGSSSSSSSNSSSSGSSSSGSSSSSSGSTTTTYTNYCDYMDSAVLSDYAFNLINSERTKLGLDPLEHDSTLNEIALIRAVEIQTDFSHDKAYSWWQTYGAFGEVLTMQGYDCGYSFAGITYENGYSSTQLTASGAVSNWMNSTAHYNIIMKSSATHLAVAYMNNRWVAVTWYD